MLRQPLVLIFLFLLACSAPKEEQSTEETQEEVKDLARVPNSWIADRVEKAKNKLNTSPAGQKLWSCIEAHGGLTKWFANGPVTFHFDYMPIDKGTRRASYQTIDQWSVKAVHEVSDDRSLKYGWDGQQAWSFPDTADVGINPRFWSTTPFYFMGLPFVLADDGVILEELPVKEFNGVTYDLVKASYEAGTGDAPDDFYVIYIHPETKLMGGLRYIVSYPGFFSEGEHLPEKFMEIPSNQTVDGITLSTAFKTYWFKDDEVAEHITNIEVSEIGFLPELEKSFFDVPEGSKIQEGL